MASSKKNEATLRMSTKAEQRHMVCSANDDLSTRTIIFQSCHDSDTTTAIVRHSAI